MLIHVFTIDLKTDKPSELLQSYASQNHSLGQAATFERKEMRDQVFYHKFLLDIITTYATAVRSIYIE